MNKHFLSPIVLQLIRFSIIGSCAAAINILVVIWLVENFNAHPLLANIFAFLIAFNISYVGHRHWSFAGTLLQHRISIPRFLLIAIISFILNEGLFYIFLSIFHWHYILALLLVLMIVPIFTFVCSKFWVFGGNSIL